MAESRRDIWVQGRAHGQREEAGELNLKGVWGRGGGTVEELGRWNCGRVGEVELWKSWGGGTVEELGRWNCGRIGEAELWKSWGGRTVE